MLNLSTGDIALITTLVTAILGGLAYYNSRRLSKNDTTQVIIDGATKLVEPLNERLDQLEKENKRLREENQNLIGRIAILERALLESPIYRIFFELTNFACAIIDSDSGAIFDANKAFAQLYSYTEDELQRMSIYDLTLQMDKTKEALDQKLTYIADRLHKDRKGRAFLVEVYVSYYDHDGKHFALCIYLPKVKTTISSRVQDILSEILFNFDADYSTLWAVHNHGVNKVSALFESAKTGNSYLLQDYLNMPSSIFDELFDHLRKEKYLILSTSDENFEPVRLLMKHANLGHMLISGVFDGGRLVGMLTTSWKQMLFKPDVLKVQDFMDCAQSKVLHEAINSSVQSIEN